MAAVTNKFHHVKSAVVDPGIDHPCHWPGCHVQIPRAMWGCKDHWNVLPKALKDRIWNAYTVGQEDYPGLVTGAYLDAASAARSWAEAYMACQRGS